MDERLIKNALGFWEIRHKPTEKELQEYYAQKYYQESKGSYEAEYSKEELMYFNVKLDQRYAVLQKFLQKQNGTMLDVGCGEGYALAFFRKRGWNVKGLDFSAAGLESKNPDCRDILQTGNVFELLDAEISRGASYDVIWLQNVLEHVIDPISLLQSLRKLVSDVGIVVITVPNDGSAIQLAAVENGHIDSHFWIAEPDHLSYFNHNSLRNTIESTGWKCLDMLAGFPVDWFLFHSGSNYVRDRQLGKLAHKARVEIENLLHHQPIDDLIKFWSAAAAIGVGRDITAFIRPVVNA